LPELSDDETMGRVSAFGYSLGYTGSFVALLLVLGVFFLGGQMGFSLEANGYLLKRVGLLIMGSWWGLFSLPILIGVRDKALPRSQPLPPIAAARQALGEVRHTLVHIRTFRTLSLFLLGFLIFNDGIATVVTQASVFAQDVIHMTTNDLLLLILLIQFVALIGAFAVGRLAERFGQKNTLMACLAVWVGALIASFWVETRPQFWALAVAVALVLGGTQSVSRTMMGLMTPKQHTAEFFGFFNLSSKAASMFGPVFFGTIMARTGKAHLALASLLLFFIVGWLFILPIDLARGQREARAENAG
jgi:UMF1 family MFS transporter